MEWATACDFWEASTGYSWGVPRAMPGTQKTVRRKFKLFITYRSKDGAFPEPLPAAKGGCCSYVQGAGEAVKCAIG